MKAAASIAGTEEGLKRYVKSVFEQFDDDNSDSIEPDEFRTLCMELGYYFDENEVSHDITWIIA